MKVNRIVIQVGIAIVVLMAVGIMTCQNPPPLSSETKIRSVESAPPAKRHLPQPARMIQTPESTSKPIPYISPTDPTLVAQRQEICQQWLAATRKVADKSGDQEAKEIANFLEQWTASGYPVAAPEWDTETATFALDNTSLDKKAYYGFVVMKPEDGRLSQAWAQLSMRTLAPVFYDARARCIVVPSKASLSEFNRGLTMLHEGFHIGRCREDYGLETSDPLVHAHEEVLAAEFQNRVTAAYFGASYQYLLETAVEQLHQKYRSVDIPIGGKNYPLMGDLDYNTLKLDGLMGVPTSQEERAELHRQY